MKYKRQSEILNLIKTYNIETQDDLIARLKEKDYKCTQATVSRDIRELNIVKVATGKNSFKYALPSHETVRYDEKYQYIIQETILSVDVACNTIVLKTLAGMAQAACAAIEALGLNEIVGCIAGDDTIFVMMRSTEKALEYQESFKNILGL